MRVRRLQATTCDWPLHGPSTAGTRARRSNVCHAHGTAALVYASRTSAAAVRNQMGSRRVGVPKTGPTRCPGAAGADLRRVVAPPRPPSGVPLRLLESSLRRVRGVLERASAATRSRVLLPRAVHRAAEPPIGRSPPSTWPFSRVGELEFPPACDQRRDPPRPRPRQDPGPTVDRPASRLVEPASSRRRFERAVVCRHSSRASSPTGRSVRGVVPQTPARLRGTSRRAAVFSGALPEARRTEPLAPEEEAGSA